MLKLTSFISERIPTLKIEKNWECTNTFIITVGICFKQKRRLMVIDYLQNPFLPSPDV